MTRPAKWLRTQTVGSQKKRSGAERTSEKDCCSNSDRASRTPSTSTARKKLAFEPRLDVQDGVGIVEFVVRTVRAIFLLAPVEGNTWTLQVVQEGYEPQVLSEFQGGMKTEQPSRRLAAARVVAAVGNWVQNAKGSQRVQTAKQPIRWRDDDESRPEPTFGTFLGHRL